MKWDYRVGWIGNPSALGRIKVQDRLIEEGLQGWELIMMPDLNWGYFKRPLDDDPPAAVAARVELLRACLAAMEYAANGQHDPQALADLYDECREAILGATGIDPALKDIPHCENSDA